MSSFELGCGPHLENVPAKKYDHISLRYSPFNILTSSVAPASRSVDIRQPVPKRKGRTQRI